MRFVDYAKESQLLRATEERLRKVAVREWVIPPPLRLQERGPILVVVRVLSYTEDFTDHMKGIEVSLHLNVSRWRSDDSAHCTLASGRMLSGGYFDHLHSPLQYLSADEIEKVAHARRITQKWIDGEIDALPMDLDL